MSGELSCPQCGRQEPDSERFCSACGMPLVRASDGEDAASERRRRARRIKPQYTQGELVKVARAQNQSEAELIEDLLLARGIPSLVQGGIDVADTLAGGRREVFVPESGAQAAREALSPSDSSARSE